MEAGDSDIVAYLKGKYDKEEITNEGNPVLETLQVEEPEEVEINDNYYDELMREQLRIELARKTTPLTAITSRTSKVENSSTSSSDLKFPDLVIPPYPDMEGDP